MAGHGDESRRPFAWGDVAPPNRDNNENYDFTPFLSAPAVQNKSPEEGKVNSINIPECSIPSPLSSNLTVAQIIAIKTRLVGHDEKAAHGTIGMEQWLSWKRAWDIWNNNYIEGRVNPVWVRQEYERMQKAKSDWDKGRDDRRRKREQARAAAAASASGQGPTDPDPLKPDDQVPHPHPPHENTGAGFSIPTDLGNKRTISGSTVSEWPLGGPVIRKARTNEWDIIAHPERKPKTPINDNEEWVSTQTSLRGGAIRWAWFLVDKTAAGSGSLPQLAKGTALPTAKLTKAPPSKAAAENAGTAHTVHTCEGIKQEEDTEMGGFQDDCLTEDIFEDIDSDSDSDPPAKPVVNADGSSGGWKPMKDLPDYYEPGQDNDDGNLVVDNVTNTVWRPRRVSETLPPKILLDDDLDEFCKDQEFKVDGGVDCGRSPFPVLRPLTVHVRTKDGAYRKKKAWDQLTGTLFNMPTQPAESPSEKPDPKAQYTKAMYEDHLRDPPQNKIFPLDIRRVLKVRPDIEPPRDFLDLGLGEQFVRELNLYSEKKYRAMYKNDPWYITDYERMNRDNPPRRHPPKEEDRKSGEHLPLDDQLWQEERLRDLKLEAGYFVTNLDGRKLVINGMEVKLGDVAGPLPTFAMIETPGNQVSFWFGVGGRQWGVDGPVFPGSAEKWKVLRQSKGWEHIAMSAGEVWDAMIKDRMEREKTGENEDDDDEWDSYKRAKKAGLPSDNPNELTPPGVGRYGPIPPFATDIHELKWLCVQDEEKKRMLDAEAKHNVLSTPMADAFFAGNEAMPKPSYVLSEIERNHRWDRIKDTQMLLQKNANEMAEKEKATRHQKVEDRLKRKAEDVAETVRKRRKLANDILKDDEERTRKAAREAEYKKQKAKFEKELSDKNLQDAAARTATLANIDASEVDKLRTFEKNQKVDAAKLEAARLEENKKRSQTGQPEIQPVAKLDLAALVELRRQQEEEARKRDDERTHRDAEDARKRDEEKKQRDAARQAQHERDQAAGRAVHEAAANRRVAEEQAAREAAQYANLGEESAFAQTVQGQLEALGKAYKASPGPAQVIAAHAFIDRLSAPKSKDEGDSYRGWKRGLSMAENTAFQRLCDACANTVRMAQEATATTQSDETKRAADQRAADKRAADQKAAADKKEAAYLQATASKKPPTDHMPQADKNLLKTAQTSDPWSREYKKAAEDDVADIVNAAQVALVTRATTLEISPEEYVKLEGFDTYHDWLAAEIAKTERDVKPVINEPKKKTGQNEDEYSFGYYVQELKEAIIDGIEARARERDVSVEEWARTKRHSQPSVDAWIEWEFKAFNLTPDQVPSRVKALSQFDKDHQKDVWRNWNAMVNKAYNFGSRTRNLPAFGEAKIKIDELGREYCEL